MRSILFVMAVLCFGTVKAQLSESRLAVRTSDFGNAFGEWKGSLTYLDYSSGKPFTMPANATLAQSANPNEIVLALVYPKEPKANGNDTLRIEKKGMEIDGAAVVSKTVNAEGILEIITERNGIDGNDNKKAVIRHIYRINKNVFSSRKEIKFDGEEKWILRNEYSFSRQ